MISRKIFSDLAEVILEGGAIKGTKYFSPNEVVKATAKRYNGKFYGHTKEILFTIGRPNYAEKKFIRDAIKCGEKFPIKKIQLKWSRLD